MNFLLIAWLIEAEVLQDLQRMARGLLRYFQCTNWLDRSRFGTWLPLLGFHRFLVFFKVLRSFNSISTQDGSTRFDNSRK
jgi:hypothetical protein